MGHIIQEIPATQEEPQRLRRPEWLKAKIPGGPGYAKLKNIIDDHRLHTVCEEARCPNMGECWHSGTATFMILGDICTRACKFCNTKTGKPLPPDISEPQRLAETIRTLGLKHCVITSVDRDDLTDGGAAFWAEVIVTIKRVNPGITIETLIPDFDGKPENISKIIIADPDVISHNVETVRRLTPQIRTRAKYDRSLGVIKYIAENGRTAKSGFMLGLGETEPEILETIDDLYNAGCRILTIGQYLKPSPDHLNVIEYITPDKFKKYRESALRKGFDVVESNPLVRSSFHAEKHVNV